MANLKETKDRIQSVKNTQKITRAMKMIAAAKVKKAENAVKMGRPFAMELFKTFVEVYNSIEDKNFEKIKTVNPIDNFPILLKEREIKKAGFILISSNKGLAGGYTSNLVKYIASKIEELNKKGIEVEIFLVGEKAQSGLNSLKRTLNFNIKEVYTSALNDVGFGAANMIAEDLAREFVEGGIDKIELITTRYINMMKYKVESWVLLPVINTKDEGVKKFFKDEFNLENKVEYETFFENKKSALEQFEPNQKVLLQKIVPMYITNLILQALLEAQASELASRMTAMSAAVKNADDMITNLTVQYNKARQESITNEIIEVISGSLNK